ncbi:sensor histidine kinase [Tenacibaculum xiamenense]|uniref:sensor histidine kinase n=1 Tax=Tenacibaculum xiamenense TaxID=1261553 RepID=UPI0038932A86
MQKEMWYTNIRNSKTSKNILIGALLITYAVIWSALNYYIKHTYTTEGDVPFYKLEIHLVFIFYCLLTPIALFHIIKYFDAKIYYPRIRQYVFLLLLVIFITLIWSIIYFVLIRLIFTGGIGIPFNLILLNAFDWEVSFGIPIVLLMLGYFYMLKNVKQKKQIDDNEKALLKNQLDLLNKGFEPHFLFNNLNILHHLVDTNQNEAKDFITDLAFLYRHIIKSNTQAIIPLIQEVSFAKKYLNIINVKFNNCYDIKFLIDDFRNIFLVPNTLQVLIENFVKHNTCDEGEKIELTIEKRHETLIISNPKKLSKKPMSASNKTGLKNLIERYELSLGAQVIVQDNEDIFTVSIPLIVEN